MWGSACFRFTDARMIYVGTVKEWYDPHGNPYRKKYLWKQESPHAAQKRDQVPAQVQGQEQCGNAVVAVQQNNLGRGKKRQKRVAPPHLAEYM